MKYIHSPKKSIDLGLDILSHRVRFGQRLPASVIAAFCDCSTQRITQYEQKALKKIKERWRGMLRAEQLTNKPN